jgi:hypothetical protein
MSPAQRAGKEPLSVDQQQILSQMQYQTHDKSLDELTEIRDKLGDKKGILANSFQVMSDPNIKVPLYNPTVESFPELPGLGLPTQQGSKELLPTSVQEVLNEPAITVDRNGDPKVVLHNQTEL